MSLIYKNVLTCSYRLHHIQSPIRAESVLKKYYIFNKLRGICDVSWFPVLFYKL